MEFHDIGMTLIEVLREETLGIVGFHEVDMTLFEVLREETLGVVGFP